MIEATHQEPCLQTALKAVNAAFFCNGFIIGHWAPKIPVMVERLGITESVLGKMIVLFGLGALIALIIGAALVARFGAHHVTRWTSLGLAPSLLFISITPTPLTTAIAMLWLGMCLGAMDNAMNTNGIEVERRIGRPVLSAMHGFWSVGGVVGGLSGGALIALFGEVGHAMIVTLVIAAITFWTWNRLLPDKPTPTTHQHSAQRSPLMQFISAIPKAPTLYVLAILTMICFASEGVIIDWSALYLKNELGSPLLVSGYAVAAFSATMAMMRLYGDGIRTRFGDSLVFITGASLAAVGMWIAGSADGFLIACIGYLISGLGMANTVPILFSAAGRFPGVRASSGVAVITVFGYGGLLFVPALVGLIAETFSLGLVFMSTGVMLLLAGGLGWLMLRGLSRPAA